MVEPDVTNYKFVKIIILLTKPSYVISDVRSYHADLSKMSTMICENKNLEFSTTISDFRDELIFH